MRQIGFLMTLLCLTAVGAMAQDATKVDPQHYKVEYEDARIRVVRIKYGPHEKSVMHEHSIGNCSIYLTDMHIKDITPDGKNAEEKVKAGTVECSPSKAGKQVHQPENLSDQPLELILVEHKVKSAAAKPGKAAKSR